MAFIFVLGQLFPDDHETLQVIPEFINHVICWQIILFELLDNNQDEQVEHDVRAHKDEEGEVAKSDITSTVNANNASVSFTSSAIEHDLVPVLTRGKGKHKQEPIEESTKVFELVDYITLRDVLEQKPTHDCEHKVDETQQNGHITERRNGEHDCLDNGLKTLLLTGELDDSCNPQHSHDSCKLWRYCQKLHRFGIHAFE